MHKQVRRRIEACELAFPDGAERKARAQNTPGQGVGGAVRNPKIVSPIPMIKATARINRVSRCAASLSRRSISARSRSIALSFLARLVSIRDSIAFIYARIAFISPLSSAIAITIAFFCSLSMFAP